MIDHKARAREILRAHPEVKSLFGPDWISAPIAAAAAAVHLALAAQSAKFDLLIWMFAAYAGGATLAQFGFLAIHELSHNLFFRSGRANKLFSILINFPLLFPFAIVFRTYHHLHHAHQGEELDLDLPTAFEARVFRGRVGKFVWLSGQLFFYALRPCFVHPVGLCFFSALNVVLQIAFDVLLVRLVGFGPVRFLLASLIFAGGLHPCAGHFLSEHVQFEPGSEQDTFSYYKGLNCVTWNVGLHVEHHDFPRIGWRKLHRLRDIAGEHYDRLEVCPSWSRALVRFVMDERVSLGASRHRVRYNDARPKIIAAQHCSNSGGRR